ncbi:unnamed protein product [Closterium sp. NIES-54]
MLACPFPVKHAQHPAPAAHKNWDNCIHLFRPNALCSELPTAPPTVLLQVEQQRVAERRAAEEAAVRRVGELLAEVRARRAAAERALKEREEKAAAHQQSRLQELRKQVRSLFRSLECALHLLRAFCLVLAAFSTASAASER